MYTISFFRLVPHQIAPSASRRTGNQGPAGLVKASLVALLVIVSVMASTGRAEAISSHCETTLSLMSGWARLDAADGISTRGWERLRVLAPVVAECVAESLPALEDEPSPIRDSVPMFRGMGTDAGQWRPLVEMYFLPDDVDRVICLIAKESGGNPFAKNSRTSAAGLMQVMPFWAEAFGRRYDDLFDPGVNLWLSRQILEVQGWHAWSSYLRGACH